MTVDVLKAMRLSMELARNRGLDHKLSGTPETDYMHLQGMFKRAQEISNRDKLNRWLGWMQASIVASSQGTITLDDMKQINRDSKVERPAQQFYSGMRKNAKTIFGRYLNYLRTWRKHRETIKSLNKLSDKQLEDIGIMRYQIDELIWLKEDKEQRCY